jgi:hypothetical protein
MKHGFLLLLLLGAAARAQYTIDWQTMDAGAGSGSAGTFAMESTLGQIDATTGAAGAIAFRGGYWALVEEPLPLLRIFVFEEDLILAWPDPSPGFVLQATPELINPDWDDVPDIPAVVGGEKQVIWGPPTGRHFFRLRRP